MTAPIGTRPLPRGVAAQLGRGLSYSWLAWRFIRTQRLWGAAGLCIGVNVLLLLALLLLSWHYAVPALNRLDTGLFGWVQTLGWVWSPLALLLRVAAWAVWLVLLLLLLLANVAILVLVGPAVAGPFLDLLSEKVEALVTGQETVKLSWRRVVATAVLSVTDLIWGVVVLGGGYLLFLVINLVPVVGAVLAGSASFALSAWVLAHQFVGLPLLRYLVPYRTRWRIVWGYRWLTLGFGAGVLLLFVLPGVNLLLLPLAAVGGTLLFCDLRVDARYSTLGADVLTSLGERQAAVAADPVHQR